LHVVQISYLNGFPLILWYLMNTSKRWHWAEASNVHIFLKMSFNKCYDVFAWMRIVASLSAAGRERETLWPKILWLCTIGCWKRNLLAVLPQRWTVTIGKCALSSDHLQD
jgi:hypothetical protein